MKNKNIFKADFSIDNLNMIEQEKIFKGLINMLDYDGRQNLHITVTDSIGGKHFIWDDKGIDPNGINCPRCKNIDCYDCPIYQSRENKNE